MMLVSACGPVSGSNPTSVPAPVVPNPANPEEVIYTFTIELKASFTLITFMTVSQVM